MLVCAAWAGLGAVGQAMTCQCVSVSVSCVQLGLAFERLGTPLSADELETHMKSVDIDGNGVCDSYHRS